MKVVYDLIFPNGDDFPLAKALRKLFYSTALIGRGVWIIQELSLAPKKFVRLFCGSRCITPRTLNMFERVQDAERAFWRTQHGRKCLRSDAAGHEAVVAGLNYPTLRVLLDDYARESQGRYAFIYWVLSFADSQCSDPRDHVYGLLGLFATGHKDVSNIRSILSADYDQSTLGVFIDVLCCGRRPDFCVSMETCIYLLELLRLKEPMRGTLEASQGDEGVVSLIGARSRACLEHPPMTLDAYTEMRRKADLAKLKFAQEQERSRSRCWTVVETSSPLRTTESPLPILCILDASQHVVGYIESVATGRHRHPYGFHDGWPYLPTSGLRECTQNSSAHWNSLPRAWSQVATEDLSSGSQSPYRHFLVYALRLGIFARNCGGSAHLGWLCGATLRISR